MKIGLIIITKNAEQMLAQVMQSVQGLVDEVIAVDQYSTDNTVKILKKYKTRVYFSKDIDYGKKKALALSKVKSEWVLNLDSDEILSDGLKTEIKKEILKKGNQNSGYYIPFQNHYLGYPVNHGGENYKMIRLFKKDHVLIKPAAVHEKFELKKGKTGQLHNKILHYSYRSIPQMFIKFHQYALDEAKQKLKNHQTSNLNKIITYPVHMFYARFIKDNGYKDGFFRVPLDIGFAYMEFITYFYIYLNQNDNK